MNTQKKDRADSRLLGFTDRYNLELSFKSFLFWVTAQKLLIYGDVINTFLRQ